MRKTWITALLGVAAIVLGLLWLKEFSQRLAHEKADRFMGPLLTVYTSTSMRLTPWFRDEDGKPHGPTWIASYDSHLNLVDFPPQIGVSVFGYVMWAYNAGNTNDWLTLTKEERDREQWLLVEAFHDTRNENETNQSVEYYGTQ